MLETDLFVECHKYLLDHGTFGEITYPPCKTEEVVCVGIAYIAQDCLFSAKIKFKHDSLNVPASRLCGHRAYQYSLIRFET